MKFRRLLYVVVILFAILMLALLLMKKRENNILKDAIVYKTKKLNALLDTVEQVISTVETKKREAGELRAYISKASPCRCEPKPYTKIPPGKYVITNIGPIIYLPENTCHPKPSDIDMELNFSDSSTLGANNIQMVLSNTEAETTGACFKMVTRKIGFTVERYALHCNASLGGTSAQDKLLVRQILIDLKPQTPLRYQLKLLVNIDCDAITGVVELYLGGQMTNSARFKMTHIPPQL